jgi:hypothetical protein
MGRWPAHYGVKEGVLELWRGRLCATPLISWTHAKHKGG